MIKKDKVFLWIVGVFTINILVNIILNKLGWKFWGTSLGISIFVGVASFIPIPFYGLSMIYKLFRRFIKDDVLKLFYGLGIFILGFLSLNLLIITIELTAFNANHKYEVISINGRKIVVATEGFLTTDYSFYSYKNPFIIQKSRLNVSLDTTNCSPPNGDNPFDPKCILSIKD